MSTYKSQENTLATEYNQALSARETARDNKRVEPNREMQNCYNSAANLSHQIPAANTWINSSKERHRNCATCIRIAPE